MMKVIVGVSWAASAVSALASAPWPVWVTAALIALAVSLAPHAVRLALGIKALNKADAKQVPAISEALFLVRAPENGRKDRKDRKK